MNRDRTMKICAIVTILACLPFTGLLVIYWLVGWFGYEPSYIGLNVLMIALLVPVGCAAVWLFLAWATYKPVPK